jgi:hypothetical protein
MKYLVMLLAVLALFAVPASAFAESSSCQTYGTETCDATAPVTGSLPFTGINVPLLVVVGGGLLGTGLAMRRVARRSL